jgi:hypothetical protein
MEPRRLALRVYTLCPEEIMSKVHWLLIVAVLCSPLPACAAEPPATPRGIAPPTRLPDPEPPALAAGEPVASATMPREVRRAVVADAARRFRVAESAVVLGRAEKLTWSDGSLGCPQTGQMYSQALVPGFRVVAKTSEGDLVYHTDTRGQAVVCAPRTSTP